MNDLHSHPSYLQLDRHCLGVALDAVVVAHASSCPRCSAYVARYRPAEQLPAWLPEALGNKSGTRARRRVYTWSAFAAAAVLCLVGSWALRDDGYDGVKGAPAALVHVQRQEGSTAVWSGEPLAPGDKIRLEVMPEEFEYVSVFSLPLGAKLPVLLYAGRVRARSATLLPKAWQLDAAPGSEALAVMFARSLISPQAAQLLLRARDPREVVIVRFDVPKHDARK